MPPPSAHPTRAGTRASTKTEIAAKRRLAKEAKQKAAEYKKLAADACKAKNLTKKQERLLSSAKSKATKAIAKADELCLKLANMTMAGAALAIPPLGETLHSHKKSKGSLGTLSITSSPASLFLQSPQRKGIAAKKRVNIQLPLCSTLQRLVELVSSGSYSSSLDGSDCLVVGEDSIDKSLPSFGLPGDPSKPSGQGSRAVACGGLHYASPFGQCHRVSFAEDCSSQLAGDSCSWVTKASVSDEEMSFGAGGEAADAAMLFSSPFNLSGGGGGSGAVGEAGDADMSSPPNLSADRGRAIHDGIWPSSHNVSLLSHFVSLHFAGDWSAYLKFAHWADACWVRCMPCS
jgi:hypothetical protein